MNAITTTTAPTTADALGIAYRDAMTARAGATLTYLGVCADWHRAQEAGTATLAAIRKAAGVSQGRAQVVTYLGRMVALHGLTVLPESGTDAVEVDLRAALQAGKGAADDVADAIDDADDLLEACDAIAALAQAARKARTTPTPATPKAETDDAGEDGADAGETPARADRDLAALVADWAALGARIAGRISKGEAVDPATAQALVAGLQAVGQAGVTAGLVRQRKAS